jgi:hypothetical protein
MLTLFIIVILGVLAFLGDQLIKQNSSRKSNINFENKMQRQANFRDLVGENTLLSFGFDIGIQYGMLRDSSIEYYSNYELEQDFFINKQNNTVLFIDYSVEDYYCFNMKDVTNVELIENRETVYLKSSTKNVPTEILINISLNSDRTFVSFVAWSGGRRIPNIHPDINDTPVRLLMESYPKYLNAAQALKALLINLSNKEKTVPPQQEQISLTNQILSLKQMKDNGILSEDEFNLAKSKILA